MSRIIIDARESGTSTGRYIDKLIEYLYKLQPRHELVILTKAHRLEFFQEITPKFEAIESRYHEFTFGEQLGFNKQLNVLQADLVHFGMTQQPMLYKRRTVTTIHDLTTVRFNNPDKNWLVFKFKQRVYRWVIRRVAKKSIALLVPSEFVKDDLVQFTGVDPDKITVTYEAADKINEPAEVVLEIGESPFIMYVGRSTPHKNLEHLVRAFQILQVDRPDLKLVLAGKKDSNYQRLEQFAAKRDAKNVVFTDFVSEGQLRWLYENCQAYVFPSLSEGFGLPGLEAMIHGAPVVSSSATCLPEIYGDGAHYFDPLDIKAMAEAINDVLADEKLRAELIKKGREHAQKYSWRRMAEQTLAIYNKALKA
jgi:glycosyltransferase involved in cell wall biosynthesis